MVIDLFMSLSIGLFSFLCGTYGLYYFLVKSYAKKQWDLDINCDFKPKLSILIPVHNEEATIEKKLANLSRISYPRNLFELIVVDDCSKDQTLAIVERFAEQSELNIRTIQQNRRVGKAGSLNRALTMASGEIIIVSDADTIWSLDILDVALPYLADSKVGAVTSMGINSNEEDSWVTKGETAYLNLVSLLRVGESKMHSTIRFEGGFCAYKRKAFDEFEYKSGADDSGTALNIVQNGWRAIFVPEARFFTWFPTSLSGKLKIKIRRAVQLISLWFGCLALAIRGQLRLPKQIAVFEFALFVVSPLVFLAAIVSGLVAVILNPLSYFSLSLVLIAIFLLMFARKLFLELLIDNLVLVYAFFSFLLGRRYITWNNREKKELL